MIKETHFCGTFLVYCSNDRETHKAKHLRFIVRNYLSFDIIKHICFVSGKGEWDGMS
jgi:hypothetical protein